MGEIFKPVGQWIAGNVGWTVLLGLFILSLFFEFSKIKLSPITALFQWIGDRITGGLKADIADMKTTTNAKLAELSTETDRQLKELKDSMDGSLAEIKAKTALSGAEFERRQKDIEERLDKLAAARIKAHVLNFSRRCRNNEKHTLEDFKNLIEENAEYEKIVEKHKWKNDVYKEDYAYVMDVYRKCLRDNDFLR